MAPGAAPATRAANRFEKQVFTTDVTMDFNEFIDCEIRNCIVQFLKLLRATGSNIFDELMNQGDQPTPAEEPRLS